MSHYFSIGNRCCRAESQTPPFYTLTCIHCHVGFDTHKFLVYSMHSQAFQRTT